MAQEESPFRYCTPGAVQIKLGAIGKLDVPEDLVVFDDDAGIAAFYKASHNVPDDGTLAVVYAKDDSFWASIRYQDTGHVSDDEKDRLGPETANAILAAIQNATEKANAINRSNGWQTLHVVGWQKPPFYDDRGRHLTWCTLARNSGGEDVANYSSRVLGRTGVVSVQMAVRPQDVERCLPAYDRLVSGIRFDQGNTYAEFRQGDRTAAYGLTGLAAGGVAVAAAKSSKGLGGLAVLVVALVGGVLAKLKAMILGVKKAFGPTAPNAAATAAGTVRKCPACGQSNRLREDAATTPTCGRCGAAFA